MVNKNKKDYSEVDLLYSNFMDKLLIEPINSVIDGSRNIFLRMQEKRALFKKILKAENYAFCKKDFQQIYCDIQENILKNTAEVDDKFGYDDSLGWYIKKPDEIKNIIKRTINSYMPK